VLINWLFPVGRSTGQNRSANEIRNRRRGLCYRGLVQRQAVQMKNRVSGLLMETGVSYNKLRLHRKGYFAKLMTTNEEVSESVRPLVMLCREHIDRSIKLDTALKAPWPHRETGGAFVCLGIYVSWHRGGEMEFPPTALLC